MSLRTYDEMHFHPMSEKLVEILCNKAQNNNPLFFRVLVAYYLAMITSMMRVSIRTHDRGMLPVNLYTLNLSPSGSGKNVAKGIIENEVTHLFQTRFIEETLPLMEETHLARIAQGRAARKNVDPDDEFKRVKREYDGLGPFLFSFDSATGPAIKQYRQKLLMAASGALNLQMDEVGSYLQSSGEVLDAFLELFDVGAGNQKLLKATAESLRSETVKGHTPTNMLLFGTPTHLLDGSKNEELLYKLLEIGYARRCFFGYARSAHKRLDQSAEEVYDQTTSRDADIFLGETAERLEKLADMVNMGTTIEISKEVTLILIEYRLHCERLAAKLAEHEVIRNHEISHRYSKALKLAGAYAFIDGSHEISEEHLYYAIKLAEESSVAFGQLLARDKHYMKLAKYLASCKTPVTQADLYEDLPFYRGSQSARQDMLLFASAWGATNNILIKKNIVDSIEWLSGESLKETDPNEIIVAYSNYITEGYRSERVPFDQLHVLTQVNGMHWISHHLNNAENGHRSDDNVVPGFNLIVLDIEKGPTLEMVREVFKNHRYHLYTTKRHTPDEHRFRVVLPTNFELKLDSREFKEFMHNVNDGLPFTQDESTGQRSRKWMSWAMHYEYHDGEPFDVLPFIPKTNKNEQRKALLQSQQEMDNLERWVINNTGDGNRNNMLLRYAMIFVDAGADEELIRLKVFGLNAKLADKLSEAELLSTILVTVSRAIQKRSSANQPVPVPVSANGTALPAPVPSMPAASGVSSRATSASQFAAPPQP